MYYLLTTWNYNSSNIIPNLYLKQIVCGQIRRQWQCKTNLLINSDRVRHRYFLGDGDSLDMFMVMILCLMMIQSMPAIPQRWCDAHKQTHPHCYVHAHGGMDALSSTAKYMYQGSRAEPLRVCACVLHNASLSWSVRCISFRVWARYLTVQEWGNTKGSVGLWGKSTKSSIRFLFKFNKLI